MFNILQVHLFLLILAVPAYSSDRIKIEFEVEMVQNVKNLMKILDKSPKDGAISIDEIDASADMDGQKFRNAMFDFCEYIRPDLNQLKKINDSLINNGNLLKRFVKDADADHNGKADFKEMLIFLYHLIEAREEADVNGDGIADFEEMKQKVKKEGPKQYPDEMMHANQKWEL